MIYQDKFSTRYHYNETHVLILVDDQVYRPNKLMAEATIDKALFQQLHIYIFFLRWMYLYDESNDCILYLSAFKVYK
jgi:hypothetical protein